MESDLRDISMVRFIPEIIRNMNYAQAAMGKLTHDQVLRYIDSQCETELGRNLDPLEKDQLFSRFSPDVVRNRIHQVCILFWVDLHLM